MADQGTSREGLVGRQDELALLHRSFDESQQGQLRLVHLAGDAGIGKSRLLGEFASRVPADTIRLTGACFEGEGAPPLWPWIQVVRAACSHDGGAASTLAPAVTSVLGKMVPELATALPSATAVARLDPASERFRLFEATGTLIDHVAQHSAIVILLDDLHWADVDSLLLLQFLVRQHTASSVMIVGTYRDFEMERSEQSRRIIADIERAGAASRVLLKGLARNDCEELARRLCASSLSEPLLEAIWESSEGNPLFVHEISRSASEGTTTPESITVPTSLRGVIKGRFADLPVGTVELLRIASVIGREFEVALLSRVVQQAAPELASALADLFDRAVHGRIVERIPASGRHRFKHALMREVLYEELAGRERIRLHGLVGAAFEEAHRANLDHHSADLAHHYYEAALGGWADAALEYNRRAGDHAYSLPAFSEAACRYRDALQVIDLTEAPVAIDRCRLLLRLGRSEFLSGSAQVAQAHLTEAADLARNLGDAHLFGEAIFAMYGVWGTAGSANPEHVRLLEEALELLPDEDSDLRVGLMGRLGTELYWTPQTERCEQLGRELIAMARRVGEPQVVARALNAAHFALWRPDNAEERLALAQENTAKGEEAGDVFLAAGGLVWSVIDYLEVGRAAEACAAIDAYGIHAGRLQSPFFCWQHGVLEAMRALLHGRLDEAEQLALNAYQAGLEAPGANADMFLGVQMLELRWHQGRLAELEEAVGGFVRQFPGLPSWRAALAFILSEQDKLDEARCELEWFGADNVAALPRDANFLITLVLLAESSAAVGDAARARGLYDLLEPYADRIVVAGNAAGCWGVVRYFLGRLAFVMRDLPAAEEHLRTAAAVHQRIGALPHLALARWGLAQALVAADRHEEATAALQDSRDTAEPIGMRRVLQLVDRMRVHAESDTGETGAIPTAPGDVAGVERVFRRDGELWSVGSPEQPLQMKGSKGLEYIAYLIAHPGQEVLAVDLARVCDAGEGRAAAGDASLRGGRDLGDAGEMLDGRARAEYGRRLDELRSELEEARGFNDVGRAERAQAEMESLTAELARAVGLGGRSRKAASHAERARINVTRAIKKAIALVEKHDRGLAHHLKSSIRTGRFCTYVADPVRPVRWRL